MIIKTIDVRSNSEAVINGVTGKVLLNITYSTPKFEISDADSGDIIVEYKGYDIPFDNTLTIIVTNHKNIRVKGL